jgi:hypothetical protein
MENGNVSVYCPGDGVWYECPAGRFGNVSGLVSSDCSGECAAGYYCPVGSSQSDEHPCGGVSVYCPPGSGSPVNVETGRYTVPESVSVFTRQGSSVCQAGEYCVGGVRYLCDGGTYSTVVGRSTACVDPCPAGYFCGNGTGVLNASIACRNVSQYCPPGSIRPVDVREGYYTIATSLGYYFDEVLCEPGWYCIGGVKQACPAGRFGSLSGETRPQCEGNCTAGYYCGAASSSPNASACGGSEYYCPAVGDAVMACVFVAMFGVSFEAGYDVCREHQLVEWREVVGTQSQHGLRSICVKMCGCVRWDRIA